MIKYEILFENDTHMVTIKVEDHNMVGAILKAKKVFIKGKYYGESNVELWVISEAKIVL